MKNLSSLKQNKSIGSFSLIVVSVLWLCSCGSSSTDEPANVGPSVDAGSSQTVNEASSVTLTGTASDSDGSITSYLWQQTAGTSVSLQNASSANATFTAPNVDADETLTFSLSVTDNDGASASDSVSIIVSNVNSGNSAPIANAGTDQTVLINTVVSLTAALSNDADNDALEYSWAFTQIPTGSNASLSSTAASEPTFNADVVGTYIIQLVVDDGIDSSEIDSVEVNVIEQLAGSTDGVFCDYDYNEFNDSASVQLTSSATWSCANGSRSLVANGVPDHAVGTFPNSGNPNTISAQSVSEDYTLSPVETNTATTLGGPRGSTGYVLNGVKIDASTAGSCDNSGSDCSLIDNSGSWSIEALGQSHFDFGTDDNNAHVQPTGAYHYHGMPEGFVSLQGGNSTTMTLIGWAADGFPIYARYGYSEANNASSTIVAMTGSYSLISTVPSTRPDTSVYALGTFAQDWEYVEGSGDLDECNGRYGVTPEFPNGIYHYYATDTYPYFQRCVKGEVDAGGGPPPF